MRRAQFVRKQRIYRAIEAEHAQKESAEALKLRNSVTVSELGARVVPERDPLQIARAARAALRGEAVA